MKNWLILSFVLSAQISSAQLKSSAVADPQSALTNCFFCNISIGSTNNPRIITELSVVGKPTNEGLPSLYEPQDLKIIDPRYITPLYRVSALERLAKENLNPSLPTKMDTMRADAYLAVTRMLDAARAQHIDLYVHSGYRSYAVQCKVFSTKLVKQLSKNGALPHAPRMYTSPYALIELNSDITKGYRTEFTPAQLKQAMSEVNTRSALPGQSEHQLGSVVDLVTMIPKYEPEIPSEATPQFSGYALEYEMQNTPAFAWLQQNAYKYGYALSYPNSETLDFTKPNIRTGYIYEPWHWRFIGVDYATRFKDCGSLVLREFLKEVSKNRNFKCQKSPVSTGH